MEEEKKQIVETEKGKSLGKTAKIIAICCFSLVMAALLFATISDVTIFAKQILHFFGGIIITAILFVLMCAAFIVSFILVFGFYIVKDKGFWPLSVAVKAFKEIIGDISFDNISVDLFSGIRMSLLITSIICFVAAIVSLSFRKAAIKNGFKDQNKHIKKFDVTTIVFSVLGIAVSSLVLLIIK